MYGLQCVNIYAHPHAQEKKLKKCTVNAQKYAYNTN